jgi:hypothetical protein
MLCCLCETPLLSARHVSPDEGVTEAATGSRLGVPFVYKFVSHLSPFRPKREPLLARDMACRTKGYLLALAL